MQKVILIFIGPPGSGKGTQADVLGKNHNLPVISPGELLRHEMERKTKIGLVVKSNMDQGKLAPTEIVEQVIDKRLKKRDTMKGFILDGYPRSRFQLEDLRRRLKRRDYQDAIVKVFHILVSDKEVRNRLKDRRVCDCGASYHLKYNPPKVANKCDLCGGKLYRRKDDDPKVVTKRLRDSARRNRFLFRYFSLHHDLINIDGEKPIADVYRQIETSYKQIIKDGKSKDKRGNRPSQGRRKKTG